MNNYKKGDRFLDENGIIYEYDSQRFDEDTLVFLRENKQFNSWEYIYISEERCSDDKYFLHHSKCINRRDDLKAMGFFDGMGTNNRKLKPEDYQIGDEFEYGDNYLYKVVGVTSEGIYINIFTKNSKITLALNYLISYDRIQRDKSIQYLLPENKINKNKQQWGVSPADQAMNTLRELDNDFLNTQPPCYHSWKLYTGLVETFHYCEKCDAKKEK